MANLAEQVIWEEFVYQIATTDPVLGGEPNLPQGEGITNVPHRALANRTAWLRAQVLTLQQSLSDLTNGAPGALDTLNELAAALGDDPNFAATITQMIGDARLPVGSALTFLGDTPPAGYLERDGSEISRTNYSELWAHAQTSGMFDATGVETSMFGPGDGLNTFTVPDHRADFERGWDHGRGVDASRALGSWQQGMGVATEIYRTFQPDNLGLWLRVDQGEIDGTVQFSTEDRAHVRYDDSSGGSLLWNQYPNADTAARSITRAVPRNTALLFCVKY